ncbi:MAG TPA: thioredoxin domain-containing protein [Trueperaceae bacterium]
MKLDSRNLTTITLVILAVLILGYIIFSQLGPGGDDSAPAGSADFRISEQPLLGDPDAPVTIVSFEDFKCPVCQRFEQTVVPQIEEELIETGRANLVFINFPFLGPDSTTAAIAGECVYNQSEELFWDYKTILFRAQGPESQQWATPERLVQLAGEYVPDIDVDELEECLEEERYEDEVAQDRQTAQASGATGTPTVFVDGEKLADWSYAAIERAVAEAAPEQSQ